MRQTFVIVSSVDLVCVETEFSFALNLGSRS